MKNNRLVEIELMPLSAPDNAGLIEIPYFHIPKIKRERSRGWRIGKFIGKLLFAFVALCCLSFMPALIGTSSLIVVLPALAVGLITGLTASSETGFLIGFLKGFAATTLIGGVAAMLMFDGSCLLYGMSLLSIDAVKAAFTTFTLSILPIALPAVALAAASYYAVIKDFNFTDALWNITKDVFYEAPTNMLAEAGHAYGEIFKSIYSVIKSLFVESPEQIDSDNESDTDESDYQSSYGSIMSTISSTASTVVPEEGLTSASLDNNTPAHLAHNILTHITAPNTDLFTSLTHTHPGPGRR
jgi:hypothetical protein